MGSRKREAPSTTADWLGLSDHDDDSDDDANQYGLQHHDSEDQKDSRSRSHRTGSKPKRRRIGLGLESDDEDGRSSDDDGDVGQLAKSEKTQIDIASGAATSTTQADSAPEPDSLPEPRTKHKSRAELTAKKAAKAAKAAAKTGVIYISRIPPFMNVHDLRRLLSPYATIGRIFATPEDAETRKRRKRSGGSTRPCFVDGWIEFEDKTAAKTVVDMLNTRTIGGKKRSAFHDDVWNLRYLTGFKWHHLTEQIANENAERAARLRAEISHATRENKIFVDNIDRAKVARGIEDKKRERGETVPERKSLRNVAVTFTQNKVKTKTDRQDRTGLVESVLPKLI